MLWMDITFLGLLDELSIYKPNITHRVRTGEPTSPPGVAPANNNICNDDNTVDGRNPAPPVMYENPVNNGISTTNLNW